VDIATLAFDEDQLKRAIDTLDVTTVNRPTCDEYGIKFGQQIDVRQDLRDPLFFLAIVCSWRLRPDDPWDPYDGIPGAPNWRQMTDQQVSVVAAVTPSIGDPEFRARLSDLVWLRQRGSAHVHARAAAEDYLNSAERLIRGKHIGHEKLRLTRAVQLAGQLGPRADLYRMTIARIENIADTPGLLHVTLAECLDVLSSSRSADGARLYKLAVERAQHIEQHEPKPHWERRFWELAAAFALQFKDEEANRAAVIKIAQAFEREAKESPRQANAAHFWEMALRTYRRISGTDPDRKRVHQELLTAQEQIKKEMIPVPIEPLDITELVSNARTRCRGKDKRRALAEIVFATPWPKKGSVREQATKTIERTPLSHMFASIKYGSTWKVSGAASGTGPTTSEVDEEALMAEMCQQIRCFIPVYVHGTIEPMRDEALLAHNVTFEDIDDFVRYSPHVPVGREPFFTLGFHHGLHGRFIDALHVLVPQLEHLLRCLLQANGVITSSLKDDRVQEEFDLNRLLVMRETERLVGEDLCFVLRVVLTERFGFNLRNELAHGMLMPGQCFSPASIYAWWLIFRIVCGPVADLIIRDDNDGSKGTSGVTA
jgi:hypothetical protein